MIAERKVGASDRAAEQHVADEGDLGGLVHEHDVARRMAGAVHDVEGEVARAATEVKSQGTTFYVFLKGSDYIFTGSSELSPKSRYSGAAQTQPPASAR